MKYYFDSTLIMEYCFNYANEHFNYDKEYEEAEKLLHNLVDLNSDWYVNDEEFIGECIENYDLGRWVEYEDIKCLIYHYSELAEDVELKSAYFKLKSYINKYSWFDSIEVYREMLLEAYFTLKERDEIRHSLLRAKRKQIERKKKITKTYILKDLNTGFYKIGKSVNPLHRERTLQAEKPTIKSIKIFDKDIESKLHSNYSKYRIRGEWFNLTPVQVKYICTHF